MISHKYKFLYVHINKCAGQAIKNGLRSSMALGGSFNTKPLGHRTLLSSMKQCEGNPDDYFKFTFVRNPWDRMVSFYHYHSKRRWDINWPWTKRNPPEFKEFIKQIYNESFNWKAVWKGRAWPGTYNQKVPLRVSNSYMWLVDENDRLLTDFIGRFENLQEDLDIVCDTIGIPRQKLPHKNKSKHEHYAEYYDNETRQIVAEEFTKDIEYFGYEFDSR